jgi:hypothetical protein
VVEPGVADVAAVRAEPGEAGDRHVERAAGFTSAAARGRASHLEQAGADDGRRAE